MDLLPSAFRIFRLSGDGLRCDKNGLAFAGIPLLRKDLGRWSPCPREEVEFAISAPVARNLNADDLALAQIAALLMKFPDPPYRRSSRSSRINMFAQLVASGLLSKDWNPDVHPRTGTPPNPGWFAPRDDGSYEVAENDKEPFETMTDATPEPTAPSEEVKTPGPPAGEAGGQKPSKERARQIIRGLRQGLKGVAEEVLQSGNIVGWIGKTLSKRLAEALIDLDALLQMSTLLTDAERKAVERAKAEALAAEDPPKTLAQLQTEPTANVEGYDLHHIVQQNPQNLNKDYFARILEKFGRQKIDAPDNLVWVPRLKHQLITGYYNSIEEASRDMLRRRAKIADDDFDTQYREGLETLRRYGVLK